MTRHPRCAATIAISIYSATLVACGNNETERTSREAVHVTSTGSMQITPEPAGLIGSKEELAEQAAKAVKGDPVAAGRVANYFAFLDPKNPDTDFWTQIAIENGNVEWIDAYAQQIFERHDAYGC